MSNFQILLVIVLLIALGFFTGKAIQDEGRIILTSEEEEGTWMSKDEILELIRNGKSFLDITESLNSSWEPSLITANVPTQLKFQKVVRRVTSNVDMARVQAFVRQFSSYHTRYVGSQTGRSSQLWLLCEVQAAVMEYPGIVTVREVNLGYYLQKSIVARLEGTDPSLKSEVVVFGAHLDSINNSGPNLQAPGADDNGSGSAVGLETLRTLVQSGIRLRRTLEFHWYAAEEIGLVGSQQIANEYRRTSVNVVAMLNMDVVGYYVNGINDIGIYTDNGNAQLAQFLRILTDEYLTFGWRNRTRTCEDEGCSDFASDHVSWSHAGFPAIMASEVVAHPKMHTAKDTIQNMNFNQVNEFIKLAIGFVVEMAEYHSSCPISLVTCQYQIQHSNPSVLY